jgi:hypothetical protein
MQVTGVLEEVQVLPGTLDRVMHWAGLAAGVDKPAAARKAEGQVKFLPALRPRLEFNGVNLLRAVQTQGHAKELFAVHEYCVRYEGVSYGICHGNRTGRNDPTHSISPRAPFIYQASLSGQIVACDLLPERRHRMPA